MNVELDDKQLEELINKAFNDGYMQGFKNGIRYVACVRFRGYCRHRPCTAAQGVFCCRECPYQQACLSKCYRSIRDDREG